MKEIRFVSLAAVLVFTNCLGEDERRFRDFLVEQNPIYRVLWERLGVLRLSKDGPPYLQIYSTGANFVMEVAADRARFEILGGEGEAFTSLIDETGTAKAVPDAEKKVLSEPIYRFQIEIVDPSVVADVLYVIENVKDLDTADSGLDGSYTFVDARNRNGQLTTFEVWSPCREKDPITAELVDFLWTFYIYARLTNLSEQDWKKYGAENFTYGFIDLSRIGLTKDHAKERLKTTFASRMQHIAKLMRTIHSK